jgi:hypothetical protein
MPLKPPETAPGPLQGCDTPWSHVSLRALIQVEDILSIYCELWLDKQQELKQLLYWERVI